MKFLFFIVILIFSRFVVADLLSDKRVLCVEGQENNTVCDIVIDSEGYVFDVVAQRRIFDSSEPSGALYSSSLYKLHDMYGMEIKNYSSARTQQFISFYYRGGKAALDRVYIFSKHMTISTGPLWRAYECRGEGRQLTRQAGLALSELAIKGACGDLEGGLLGSATVISPPSISGSLFVTATVYKKSKQEGTASYFFLDSDEPDLFRMACYSNCAVPLRKMVYYAGLIFPSTLFRADLTLDGCQTQGGYQLEGAADVIKVRGCMTAEAMSLSGYARETKEVRAAFSGVAYGDGFKGEGILKGGDKGGSYFMLPLTIY